MTRAATLAACALFCTTACTETRSLGPFELRLGFDTSEDSDCANSSCQDYSLACSATMRLAIFDVEDERWLTERCIDVVPQTDLCGIDNIVVPAFENLPAHRLWFEVALWSKKALLDDPILAGTCPKQELFDLQGRPRSDLMPNMAFGKGEFFDLRDDAKQLLVDLRCPSPEQVSAETCKPDTLQITAFVTDISTTLDVTNGQAAQLSVGVGEPHLVGEGDSTYALEAADTLNLPLVAGGIPRFSAQIMRNFSSNACLLILDVAAATTPSVTCLPVADDNIPMSMRGLLVSKEILDMMLGALARPTLPADGLVVGRVVDHTGEPLAGVTVQASSGNVLYLNENLDGTVTGESTSNGYFTSLDVPFGSIWTALLPDGRTENGLYQTGLVNGKVTSILLVLNPPQ